MKKVVVTGGAGFIGSHLAEELAGKGYQVVILDDLSTGKMKNIESLLKKGNVDFVKGSITGPSLLNKLFKNVYYVFHLAAIPSVPRSVEDPQASHEVNVNGTLNVLLAARENNVKKVIYASSSSVYGDTPTLPKSEDMMPRPQSPYAVTKLTGEYYCQVFSNVYGLPAVCLRYFNVYGARQDPNSRYASVIPTFIKKVSEGKPPVIFGDGEQTRDFTFVKDAVQATVLAAEDDAQGVFNIARGESITINQLARLVIGLIGKNGNPVYEAPRPGDIRHSLADISKARAFRYQPKYTLKDGLSETIRWL
ncbi:MAG: SDR family oxidoreductase [Dehalococcoidales bacterium]|nr:SDR family oxidoreductase [Dehalococcoidales bacterium]MDZ4230425.1 SDR family oxidoreductase [Dehalococcoidales bacterium]